MFFVVPGSGREFEIPDEWWCFCEMNSWQRQSYFFPYSHSEGDSIELIEVTAITPPSRNEGVAMFKKFKLVPVLMAFQSPECELPPVILTKPATEHDRYTLRNGFHRFYASVAAGYTHVPCKVIDRWHEA